VGTGIQAWDWKRIFIGEAPYEFLIEVLIRTLIVYILLLVVIRLMGKRMGGQVSISDMAVLITLGAIVSPGMQSPQHAILFTVTALVTVYLLHQFVNRFSTKNENFLKVSEGTYECLVKDGILQIDTMKNAGVTRQELFAELRSNKIDNLSAVKRVYLEACGSFSIYLNREPKAGLVLFPEKDREILNSKQIENNGIKACTNCGHIQHLKNNKDKCTVCKKNSWQNAYVN
jgi:uncharacterized membrane protein YcaP (DUF421 family)